MTKKGIDISRYQGKPDFAKLKNEVDFVILQAGYGRYAGQKDSEFERSYSECKKYGIPVGAYWFSYATSPQDAIYEASACIEVIKGKKFEYPIYFDIEGAACSGDVSGKCFNFCNELEKKGYFAGIYISRSPAQQYLSADVCKNYALWLAEYGGALNWGGTPAGMWQNSDNGRFSGISGNVDTDICYVDYPKLIKSAGLNGFELPDEPTEELDSTENRWYFYGMPKTTENMRGLYAIKQRMKALGYSYLDDTGGFGGGTEKAVNSLLTEWGYKPNGIIGENFVQKIMK
jgi:GH25 family lysozyme M1 (1,4-beta-N-acetylmuramidase)